jgi:hypothetical protein
MPIFPDVTLITGTKICLEMARKDCAQRAQSSP